MSNRASCAARSLPTPHNVVTGVARGEVLVSAGGIGGTIQTTVARFNGKAAPAIKLFLFSKKPGSYKRKLRPKAKRNH